MSVLIKGGRIVTAADDYVADVLVEGERVVLIGESLDVDADHLVPLLGEARRRHTADVAQPENADPHGLPP